MPTPSSHPSTWGNPEHNPYTDLPSFATVQQELKQRNKHLPVTHTQEPVVTGTSVLAIKYKEGVMMAADTLASYGSLARFRDVQRIVSVNNNTLVGASGDMSDFQEIERKLQALEIDDNNMEDGTCLKAPNIYAYLQNELYERRNKSNPLWVQLVVAGIKDKKAYLGYVDLKGNPYTSSTIATGYGAHIGQPLLRKAVEGREDTMTHDEAKALLEECMRVLFYRDARSLNKFHIATVTAEGTTISKAYENTTEWGFAETVRGYGAAIRA